MKNIKVVLLIVLALTLTACKSDRVSIADHISPLIIKYHYDKDVDTSRLSKKEKKLFNAFIESQKINNKIINISEAVIFSEESYEEGNNTKGIYQNGDEYFIKFTDLVWESVDDDYKSHLVLNHMGTLIFRSLFPVLYDETKDNVIYRYRYYNKSLYDDHIDYFYKSIGDKSGLIIRYHNDQKGNVKSISLIYQELFSYYGNSEQKEDNVVNKALVLSAVGLIIVVAFIVLFIKLTH